MTGLEPAAVLVKPISTAVGKIVGGLVGKGLSDIAFRRELRQRGAESVTLRSDALDTLTVSNATLLNSFLLSTDYEDFVRRLATSAIADTKESYREPHTEELTHRLRLTLVGVAEKDARSISLVLINESLRLIAVYVTQSDIAEKLTRKQLARLAPYATSEIASTKLHASVLAQIESRRRVDLFADALGPQLLQRHGRIKLPQLGSTINLAIEDIYTKPSLRSKTQVKLEADEVLRFHRVVILGDPGGGKSTLAHYLCHSLATADRPEQSPVPMMVVLREFLVEFSSSKRLLFQTLLDSCRSEYNLQPDETALEYLALNGRLLVVFDGLDELLDISLREKVTNAINTFATRYSRAKIIVTSRRVGYDEAPLDDKLFERVGLEPFDEPAVRDYALRWFRFDESTPKTKEVLFADSFVKSSDHVNDIRSNPLLLALMCTIYSTENYIPQNRAEVYRKCSTLLFERWDKNRKIEVDLPAKSAVLPIVSRLASWIVGDPVREKGVKRSAVVEFIAGALNRKYEDEDEATAAADKFVDFFTGRAWILTDVGSTKTEYIYGFTHRTFLEYFAAVQINREAKSSGKALHATLSASIRASTKDVISQVCLQLLFERDEEEGDVFLRELLEELESDNLSAKEQNAVCSFLARSLHSCAPTAQLLRRIVRVICVRFSSSDELAWSRGGEPRPTSPDAARALPMYELMDCSEENLNLVSDELEKQVASNLSDRSNSHMGTLALALYPAGFYRQGTRALSTQNLNFWAGRAPQLRTYGETLVQTESANSEWIKEYSYSQGTFSVAELTKAKSPQRLVIANSPEWSMTLPLATRILARISTNPWHLEELVDRSVVEPENAEKIVRWLLTKRLPWRVVPSGEAGIAIDLRRFSRMRLPEPLSVATLYALTAIFQADYSFSSSATSARENSRTEAFQIATGRLFEGYRVNTLPVMAEARDFVHRWQIGTIKSVMPQPNSSR